MEKVEIHFEIDSVCMMECLHCSVVKKGEVTPPNGIVIENLYKEIDRLSDNHECYLCLTGGEPLLSKYLLSILAKFKDIKHLNIGLFTSGCFPNSRACHSVGVRFAQNLSKRNVKFVYISLYSHLSKVHDFITNIPGSHTATVTTIRNLVKAGIDVRINHVLTRQNILDIKDFIQYCSNMEVSEVRLLRLVEHGRAKDSWSTIGVTKEEQDFAVATIIEQNQHDIKITVAGFPELTACRPFDLGPSCQAGSRLFFIDKLGDVYPCACRKNDPSSVLLHLGDYPLPVASCVSKCCLQDDKA